MISVILDIETTGPSPELAGILQMAAIKMDLSTGSSFDKFHTYIRHDGELIPPHIQKITGIRNKDLITAPSAEQAIKSFAKYAADAESLIAHNARRFEVPFLSLACERHGITVRKVKAWDTADLSSLIWGPDVKHTFDEVLKRLGVSTQGLRRHHAPDDVTLMCHALRQLLNGGFNLAEWSSFEGCLPIWPNAGSQ